MTKKPSSFEDAYKMLDEACLDLNGPGLKELAMNEVANFQMGFARELKDTKKEMLNGAGELSLIAKDLGALGLGHAEEVLDHVSENVKANPLVWAGGAAAGALALGFLLSRPARERDVLAPLIDQDLTADSDLTMIEQQTEGTLP